MRTDVTIRIATKADLDALVQLAVDFRDHVEQSTPSAAEFRASIALLLGEASTEFFLATTPTGAAVGYVQCRYRYSAWRLALEAELEDVFVVCEVRRRGVGQRLVAFAIARAIAKGCRSLASAPMSATSRRSPCISAWALSPTICGGRAGGTSGCSGRSTRPESDVQGAGAVTVPSACTGPNHAVERTGKKLGLFPRRSPPALA
jgi:GNAT superfamily N-acetyltransferase